MTIRPNTRSTRLAKRPRLGRLGDSGVLGAELASRAHLALTKDKHVMINAVHVVLYTKDARRLRAFFRDTLKFRSVDAGDGWLIFALPPAELGVHPAKKNEHELYLMCDDIEDTVKNLKRKGVIFTEPVRDVGFGLLTSMKVPGGGELGLYEPKHKSPLKPTKKLRPR